MLSTTAETTTTSAAPRPVLRLVDPVAGPPAADLRDISPRLLLCFVTLAEELHFGRAADRLFVAQSALSRSIQQFERVLDRRLFARTTRSVTLMPAGVELLDPAREVLDALATLRADLAGAHPALRAGHVPGSDTTALILDRLARSEPALVAAEQTVSAADQLAAVRDGRLDVALCRAPVRLAPELRSKVVRLDPLLVAVLGREVGNDRPVDPRRRTVATTDSTTEDADYAAFVEAFERRAGCALRRVGTPAGCGTEAYTMRRGGALAFVTLASRGVRLDAPCSLAGTVPVQAYYPWSVVWRATGRSAAVGSFLAAAEAVAAERSWLDVSALPGEPWIGVAGDA